MEDSNQNTYLYILDFSDETVCKIKLTDEDWNKTTEDVLKEHGCNIDTCLTMYSCNDIKYITDI